MEFAELIFWFVVLVVVYSFFKRKRRRKAKRRPQKDAPGLYWTMHERAERLRQQLETYVFKHESDQAKWGKIVEKYEAWLRQSEECAKIRCVENDGKCMYTPTETLFYILESSRRPDLAGNYVKRLKKIGYNAPQRARESAIKSMRLDRPGS